MLLLRPGRVVAVDDDAVAVAAEFVALPVDVGQLQLLTYECVDFA